MRPGGRQVHADSRRPGDTPRAVDARPKGALPPRVPTVSGTPPRLLTLSEQIAEHLARDIVRQALAPGQRLKEVELSQQFGASRAPVRDALRLLEQRGLVRIEPRRGVRVTQLSTTEIENLYEIRAALLALAARRAAARRDAQFLALANAHLQQMARHVGDASADRYFESTYALSSLVADAADNPHLSTLIASFAAQVARYTRMSLESLVRRRQSLANWRRLVAAIQAGRADEAAAVQTELVFGSRDQVHKLVAPGKATSR